MQVQVEQGHQTRGFIEEACERAKTQAALAQGKLDACEDELGEEKAKCADLEQQIAELLQNDSQVTENEQKRRITAELQNSKL